MLIWLSEWFVQSFYEQNVNESFLNFADPVEKLKQTSEEQDPEKNEGIQLNSYIKFKY